MDQISIFNETNQIINQDLVESLIKAVLASEQKSKIELNVIFVDNHAIQLINQEYRAIDQPTDVISFAFCDSPSIIEYEYELLGDIYISVDKAGEQAIEYGHSFDREIGFLVVHGMFHLLGYDHIDDGDAAIMRQKEEGILNANRNTKRE